MLRCAILASLLLNEFGVGKAARIGGLAKSKGSAMPSQTETWPTALNATYEVIRKLATGMEGAAWLVARRSDGKKSVIKVADLEARPYDKVNNHVISRSFALQCGAMRWMRYAGCRAGDGGELLRLHESYIPECEDAGTEQTQGFQYIAMPVAGSIELGDILKSRQINEVSRQRSIFAQLVAAIYSLHKVGVLHNDLHGSNILLDRQDRLSLIDFGWMSFNTSTADFCISGFSRDGNALYRYATKLANCPQNARYHWRLHHFSGLRGSQRRHQNRALDCFKENWGADEAFIQAMAKVFDSNFEATTAQHIQELYHTKFVQNHLPAPIARFRLGDASLADKHCTEWSHKALVGEMLKVGAVQPPTHDAKSSSSEWIHGSPLYWFGDK